MRTAEELTKEMNAQGANPLNDMDAWFDGLLPEERAILLENVDSDPVVPRSCYTEPHDAAKQEAARRAQRSVRPFGGPAAGSADVGGADSLFGATFAVEDGDVGVLEVDDESETSEPTAAEAEHHVHGWGRWNSRDWDQRRRFALLAAQRAREAFHSATDTIDVWGVRRSLRMAVKAGLREGARRLFIWSERFG